MTDGRCGPDYGPNCPAWRTFKTLKINKLNEIGKFQGSSGMIYWGNKIEVWGKGHDGYCGPNYGPPCDECLHEIWDKEKIDEFNEKFKYLKESNKSLWIIF